MNFFKNYSYSIVKLFLNQIGMTVFGTVLTIATRNNPSLLLASGILSIGLYIFLAYSVCWEIGAKDKIKIDGGRLEPFPARGFIIAFIANIPNILLSLLVGLGLLINSDWSNTMAGICNIIVRLLNGMYQGVIKLIGDGISKNAVPGAMYESTPIEMTWWWFIIATLPVIIVGGLAYFLGSKNISLSKKLGINSSASGKNKK